MLRISTSDSWVLDGENGLGDEIGASYGTRVFDFYGWCFLWGHRFTFRLRVWFLHFLGCLKV